MGVDLWLTSALAVLALEGANPTTEAAQPAAAPSAAPAPADAGRRADDAAQPRSTAPVQTPRVGRPDAAAPSTSATPEAAATGVTAYPASFFTPYQLLTALDMVNRLPGFSFDAGGSVRGLSGAAGNVLIDGRRPASKSDSVDAVLNRIAVSEVERIDVVRGGAPGIDMQGRSIVANVIRKGGDRTRVTLTAVDDVWDDGHSVPGGNVQFSRQAGRHTFEGQISRVQSFDDSVGDGRIVTTTAPGTPAASVLSQPARTTGTGGGVAITGGYKGPQLGGDLRLNLRLQETYFKQGLSYGEHPPNDAINDRSRSRSAELGLNFDRSFGPWETESVLLQRLGRSFAAEQELTRAPLPTSVTDFSQVNNTTESIGRFVVRRAWTPKLTLEAGVEGVFNQLDGSTRLNADGAPIPLPSQDVHVEELRAEGYGQARWRATDKLTVEAALRVEGSDISESGDARQERTFTYVKPRVNLTWDATADDQLRLRAENKVGQLDFASFVSKTDLTASTLNAGNPDLRPDQRWQFEAALEHRFWKRGSVTVTYLHEEITDVVDLIPIVGPGFRFDSPGNIGSGTNDELSILATIPLERLGISGGLLKTTSIWRNSEVTDPLTGRPRRISGQRPDDLEATFTQDIAHLHSTWALTWFNGWRETYYRAGEVQRFRIPPAYVGFYWDYKPKPDLSIRLSLLNLVPFTFERKRTIYSGARELSTVAVQEDRVVQSQPRLELRLRKSFG